MEAIGFLLIFSIIGSYIYINYTRSVQENSDQILSNMVLRVQHDAQNGVKRLTIPQLGGSDPSSQNPDDNSQSGFLKSDGSSQDTIYYDNRGDILNNYSLGLRLWTYQGLYHKILRGYDGTMTVRLDNSYFRVRLIRLNAPIEIFYGDSPRPLGMATSAAVVYNYDTELSNIRYFRVVLLWALILAAFLSLIVSWLVTLRVMKPILLSWNQQQNFVNNAAHELRTPLTIIQNKLENLLRKPTSSVADVSENVVISLSEVRRLSRLTSDMLTLAKTGSNMTKLEPERVDAGHFIREITEPYSEIAKSEGKQFSDDIKVRGQIVTDTKRFHQLIVILLDNALKYTDEGDSISLFAGRDKNNLIIKVSDTGMGISSKGKKRVFDRFYREEKSGNRKTGGTGLGLSIAKWIVDAFKGEITISDNSPKGTIFKVTLPKLKMREKNSKK